MVALGLPHRFKNVGFSDPPGQGAAGRHARRRPGHHSGHPSRRGCSRRTRRNVPGAQRALCRRARLAISTGRRRPRAARPSRFCAARRPLWLKYCPSDPSPGRGRIRAAPKPPGMRLARCAGTCRGRACATAPSWRREDCLPPHWSNAGRSSHIGGKTGHAIACECQARSRGSNGCAALIEGRASGSQSPSTNRPLASVSPLDEFILCLSADVRRPYAPRLHLPPGWLFRHSGST
jgi:hypothetical protein